MEIQTYNKLSKCDIAIKTKKKNANGAKISLMLLMPPAWHMITLNDAASRNNNNKINKQQQVLEQLSL